MEDKLFAIYVVIATIIGWRWLNGRVEWLDRKNLFNQLVKLVLGFMIGFCFSFIIMVCYIFKIIWR